MKSSLIPRNLSDSYDAAADNYPYLVWNAYLTGNSKDQSLVKTMLDAELKLATRPDGLPDTYSFSKQSFLHNESNPGELIFGTAEYIKDGPLPITELLGKSVWSEHLFRLLDNLGTKGHLFTGIEKYLYASTPGIEISGDLLLTLPRAY
ncbi:MAG: hypothetical protein IT292_06720 [Deltaproteobacteria bacterium]|nr:hypothetical protein [Deltaproteobacteria bacterium]